MSAEFGPCADWPFHPTCDLGAIEGAPAVTGYAVAFATRTLWALSGRQFGTCEVTLRPMDRSCESNWLTFGHAPWVDWNSWVGDGIYGGYWFPFGCADCTELSELRLPSPVNHMVSVLIDGTPLATGSYRVDDNRTLVRTDGRRWPRHNDLAKGDTEPGTWSVTAAYGKDIPESAALAMGELVCEITRAAAGQDCRLPPGVTQLARQGVTISYPDVGELLRNGRTGLYLVDMFLATENPYNLKQRARTYSVDGPKLRRAGT